MIKIRIDQAKDYLDQQVYLEGWVHHKRSSGKIRFLHFRDGSGFIQAIFLLPSCDLSSFETFSDLTQESSVRLWGKIQADARSKTGFELIVEKMEVLQIAEAFPISPKEHGVEFLMQNRHLWLRSQRQWACLRIRNAIAQAVHGFFQKKGFIQFDSPILTPSSCEGTSTLFHTDYFDQKAYLTQSGQLYGEAGAFAFGKIYSFGPTFRAEKSKTRKHLTEFWMVEPEIAFVSFEELISLAQGLIHAVIQFLLDNMTLELGLCDQQEEKLKKFLVPYPVISYDQALLILQQKGFDLVWGDDFGSPHETALGEHFALPVFITHFPADMKSFYFKRTPDNRLALGCDLIAPEGYGEIIGGGLREEQTEVLSERVSSSGLNKEDYQWYLDLRRFGSCPHGGFGLGLERMVAWMTSSDHVRETIPFARLLNHLSP